MLLKALFQIDYTKAIKTNYPFPSAAIDCVILNEFAKFNRRNFQKLNHCGGREHSKFAIEYLVVVPYENDMRYSWSVDYKRL